MKKTIIRTIFAVMAIFSASVFAQSQIIVATGPKEAVNTKILEQIKQVCPSPAITEVNTSGGPDNVQRLVENTVNVGFVPLDTMIARKMIDGDQDVENLRTLVNLFPQTLHTITKQNNQFVTTFSSLGNKRIGVFGSGLVTARVAFAKTHVTPASVRSYSGWSDLKAALDKGDVDVIIGSGGAPIDFIKGLNGSTYRFVPFDMFDKVADVYQVNTVTYNNLGGSFKTISIPMLLVTQNYTSAANVKLVSDFRNCILDNLAALRETTGFSPLWRQVNPKDKGAWPYFVGNGSTAPAKASKKH